MAGRLPINRDAALPDGSNRQYQLRGLPPRSLQPRRFASRRNPSQPAFERQRPKGPSSSKRHEVGRASLNDVQLRIELPKGAQTSLILLTLTAIGNGFGCVLAGETSTICDETLRPKSAMSAFNEVVIHHTAALAALGHIPGAEFA